MQNKINPQVTDNVDSLFLGSITEIGAGTGANVDEIIADTEPPRRTTLVIGNH